MKTIQESLGEYENSDNEKIEIIRNKDNTYQIKYENGQVENINTLGHYDGWWLTSTGSIKFGEKYLLLSNGGIDLGSNSVIYKSLS